MNEFPTAATVLSEVEQMLSEHRSFYMRDVYKRLSIFDWFKDTLSQRNLTEMAGFLREAIKLGFTGYVCFKVGVSGCANGMWAHTELSTNGHSPDGGECLFRSFTPDYTYWGFTRNGKWIPEEEFDSLKNVRMLEKAYKEG